MEKSTLAKTISSITHQLNQQEVGRVVGKKAQGNSIIQFQ